MLWKVEEIELNEEQRTAIRLILQGKNVCLLGSAGTGKTATIQEVCRILVKMRKRVKKVSLYGLAAQLIGGTTIHKLLKIPWMLKGFIPSKQNVRQIQNVDVLITGDIGHHEGLDSMDMGFAVIEAGHYGLEQVFIGHLCEYIESKTSDVKAVPFFEGMPYQVL